MATVLTDTGKTWIRDSLSGTSVLSPATADYIGWGVGTVGASTTSTALSNETSSGASNNGESRVLATRTLSGDDIIQWVGTLTANDSRAITEAGNFTGATSADPGSLVVMGDFSAVNLNANDSIQFTINLQIT